MSSDGSRVSVLKSGLYQVYAQLDWDLGARESGRLQLRAGRHNTNNANSTLLATCIVTGKSDRGIPTVYTYRTGLGHGVVHHEGRIRQ